MIVKFSKEPIILKSWELIKVEIFLQAELTNLFKEGFPSDRKFT